MKNPDNDNEELSFITLGAATLNVVRYLEASDEKKVERERDAQHDREDKEKAEQHRRAVDQGLRDIAAFEERASGKTVRVRRK
jgi:hypothetical protein